jgi:hypothetical protein
MEMIPYKGTALRGGNPIIKWEMTADSEGVPLETHDLKILSVAFESEDGLFHGAEAALEGAIGDKFHFITTPHETFVSTSIESIKSVSGRYVRVRPRILGGSDKTNITVTIFARKLSR